MEWRRTHLIGSLQLGVKLAEDLLQLLPDHVGKDVQAPSVKATPPSVSSRQHSPLPPNQRARGSPTAPELRGTRGGDGVPSCNTSFVYIAHPLCCRDGDALGALPAAARPNPTLTLQPCSNAAPSATGTQRALQRCSHLFPPRALLYRGSCCSPCRTKPQGTERGSTYLWGIPMIT